MPLLDLKSFKNTHNGATVLIGLIEKSHKHKGFEQSINSIILREQKITNFSLDFFLKIAYNRNVRNSENQNLKKELILC